jgi:hypothetical protein
MLLLEPLVQALVAAINEFSVIEREALAPAHVSPNISITYTYTQKHEKRHKIDTGTDTCYLNRKTHAQKQTQRDRNK